MKKLLIIAWINGLLLSGYATAAPAAGTVWAWGYNLNGQLGDGTSTTRLSPVPVSALGNVVVSIAAGGSHSLARKNDGTVWAWGYNAQGQLGDGTSGPAADRSTPVPVTGLINVASIKAGGSHSLALQNDATVHGRERGHRHDEEQNVEPGQDHHHATTEAGRVDNEQEQCEQ